MRARYESRGPRAVRSSPPPPPTHTCTHTHRHTVPHPQAQIHRARTPDASAQARARMRATHPGGSHRGGGKLHVGLGRGVGVRNVLLVLLRRSYKSDIGLGIRGRGQGKYLPCSGTQWPHRTRQNVPMRTRAASITQLLMRTTFCIRSFLYTWARRYVMISSPEAFLHLR